MNLAKRHRRYAMDSGLFVSLKEKIARKPIVKELIATPIIRAGILTNIKPGSFRYKQGSPEKNYRLTTFDKRARQLRQFKAQGLSTRRTDGLRDRAACYHWSRQNLGFVGTEAAADWTIPYADFSSPLSPGKAIPVPLFNLVYHDAIITPYQPGDLHGLLNGGAPQMFGARDLTSEDLALIRRMCALHERVALLEMTGHEFLDQNYRKERSTFADGTTVTVDWDAKTVQINLTS